MSLEFKEPVLLLGIGGAGSRVVNEVKKYTNFDSMIISHDSKDLTNDTESIKISTNGFVNPSVNLIRGFASQQIEAIQNKISHYETVLLVTNLAGKTGAAVGPVISRTVKDAGKNLISFAIMPFKFENDRIFASGVSLKRIKADSDSTVIFDNDAILECNPELNIKECYKISNSAMTHVISSVNDSIIGHVNVISTSTDSDLETSVKNSLKMLYENASPNTIKQSIVYIMGADKVPIGAINAINTITNSISNGKSNISSNTTTDSSGVVMVSSVQGETRFDKYDPLGMISSENTLDWDEPECSIDCKLNLYQLE